MQASLLLLIDLMPFPWQSYSTSTDLSSAKLVAPRGRPLVQGSKDLGTDHVFHQKCKIVTSLCSNLASLPVSTILQEASKLGSHQHPLLQLLDHFRRLPANVPEQARPEKVAKLLLIIEISPSPSSWTLLQVAECMFNSEEGQPKGRDVSCGPVHNTVQVAEIVEEHVASVEIHVVHSHWVIRRQDVVQVVADVQDLAVEDLWQAK